VTSRPSAPGSAAFRSARELALGVLERVEREQAYSNLLLNRYLEQARFGRQDAALATELVYGTIQRRNTIDHILDRLVAKGISSLEPWVKNLLRLSVYQLRYLDRIPAHAAVHEAVDIAKRRGHRGIAGMVNGVLRAYLREPDRLTLPADADDAARIALEHSHPEWLVRRWIDRFGPETAEAMCAANNVPPHVSIRANTLRTSRDRLLAELAERGIQAKPSPLSQAGIIVENAGNMAHDPGYAQGLFSIQDESSMLVAEVVRPEPGMNVLDCCAAPGGKSAHMAELMNDRGTIWANDIHAHKERLVRSQIERLGLASVRTLTEDALRLKDRFRPQSFDRILLDAPCSGLGVIRRKPDLKWTKTERQIEDIARMQLSLLKAVADLLKPGGVLVYSTCTVEYTENERVVQAFLAEREDFAADERLADCVPSVVRDRIHLPGMLHILPHWFHSDGFFIARMERRFIREERTGP